MNDDSKFNNDQADLLDSAISSIKTDRPSDVDITAAKKNVYDSISAELNQLYKQQNADSISFDTLDHYIAAVPDYLNNQLTPERKALFEEESRRSLPLRRALDAARKQVEQDHQQEKTQSRSGFQWFTRIALFAILAISVTLIAPKLPSFNQSKLAQIEEIEGQLYQVSDGRLSELVQGAWIQGNQDVRTSNNGGAILVLNDGSRIEVNARTELSLTRHYFGNRIEVERGRIFVEASPQGSGALEVITNELHVSVTGTIFEVGHGSVGSRVAVIEGEVQVTQQGNTESLLPGEQVSSRSDALSRSIHEEIAWSKNADEYIEMLTALSALKKDIDTALDVEPRYSVRLLSLVPKDTVAYISVPNAPEKISEVYQLLKSHMQQLGRTQTQDVEQLDEFMHWLDEIGDMLGNETVVSISMDVSDEGIRLNPLVLSEVSAEMFSESLSSKLQEHQAAANNADQQHRMNITLVNDPDDAQSGDVSIWLNNDLLIASTEPVLIKSVRTTLQKGHSDFTDNNFYHLLKESYNQGAEFLGAAHLTGIMSAVNSTGNEKSKAGLNMLGLSNAQYLLVERRQLGDRTTMTAELLFDGERSGMMSWLASPSAMTSLEFFSIDASSAASAVFKDPAMIVDEIETMIEQASSSSQSYQHGAFQNELQEYIRSNVVKSLGGELAIGLDGPLMPKPSWKFAIETYDETTLQESIEHIIKRVNTEMSLQSQPFSLQIKQLSFGSYQGYRIECQSLVQHSTLPQTLYYAYIDGYLVAAPTEVQIINSIKYYQTGSNILTDARFQSLLPNNGQLDFSVLVFNRVADIVSSLVKKMPKSTFTDEQKEIIEQLKSNTASLYGVSVHQNSFRLVQNGNSELPFTIIQLLSLRSILKSSLNNDSKSTLEENMDI